ncbi:MAG: hypothetical protein F4213_22980 [Boseongicola sp. SB0677_bin_26]|nr:hypothetical protein [Boseongicola sp. SB0665_bin_10]MYG28843.1 hypothetical protein [Boseongicola sp. SB0677_bin_26]
MTGRCITVVPRRRWRADPLGRLATLILAASDGRLTVPNEVRAGLGRNNPQLAAVAAFEAALIALAPNESSVFASETLNAVEAKTEPFWGRPVQNSGTLVCGVAMRMLSSTF